MSLETYQNAIKKIEDDPLSFLFCSHATKRERQLSKFRQAVEQMRAADGWQMPSEQELWKAVEFAREKTGYYTRRR